MDSNKPYLIVATRPGCPPCELFESKEKSLLNKLILSAPKIIKDVIYINIYEAAKSNEHPDLRKGIIGWTPEFILIPAELWESHTSKLDVVIMNGKIDTNGKAVTAQVTHPFSADGIYKWIQNEINTNKILRKNYTTSSTSKQTSMGSKLMPSACDEEYYLSV